MNALCARPSLSASLERIRRPAVIVFWLVLLAVFAGPAWLLVGVALGLALRTWDVRRGRLLDPWSWLRHFSQMVVAMDLGMLVYHAAARPAAATLVGGAPFDGDAGYVWMVASMVVGMVALMRYQGHSWGMANEMTAGMLVPIAVCFALVRLGICPLVPFLGWLNESNVYGVAHAGMLLGMLAVMVWRRAMYAEGPTGVIRAHVHAALTAEGAL